MRTKAKRKQEPGVVSTPLTTADGMTWLDPEGNEPHVDKDGKLTKPFILRLVHSDGTHKAYEVWTEGLKLPDTPAAFAKWSAEVEAARNKRLGIKAPEASEATAFKVTRTGKRKRKADAELTPAQLKRRQYNKQRNAEKKRRKS